MSNHCKNVTLFKKPSMHHRLIILTIKSVYISMTFEDSDGNWPRHIFISLPVNEERLNQLTWRFTRNSKSDIRVGFVYDKKNPRELVKLKGKKLLEEIEE